jgi:hypothetical protein
MPILAGRLIFFFVPAVMITSFECVPACLDFSPLKKSSGPACFFYNGFRKNLGGVQHGNPGLQTF